MKNNLHFRLILFCFILSFRLSSNAQDYKFSQFYNSPLNLNPAFTGKINSLFRVVANYRIQYLPLQSSPTPYNTLSASADFGLLRDKLKGDIFGAGILFTNDRQTSIRSNVAMVSLAYHKSLGKNKNHYLSVGTQIGFTQRTLDNNLIFANQFDTINNFFNTRWPNYENFATGKYFKPNLNLGLFWSSNFNKMLGAYAGVSIFNILKPKDTFFKSDNERAMRFNAHAGLFIDINRFVLISPNGMYMFQAKAQQWIAGSSFSFNLSGKQEPYKTAISTGFWYDGNGAVIASAGVSFLGLQIGVSYDATIKKDLSKAVKSFGALEASIIYTGKPLDKKKAYSPLLCPKF